MELIGDTETVSQDVEYRSDVAAHYLSALQADGQTRPVTESY